MLLASCHCGAVRFEIAERPETVTDCNCSICRRLGGLWAYYRKDQVRIIAAPDATSAYVWGDRMLEFHHCQTCGCATHGVSTEKGDPDRITINARLFDPADLVGMPIRKFDGAESWTYLS